MDSKNRKQNTDSLPVVEFNIAGQNVLGFKDSGAEICVLRKSLIRRESATEGHIYLVPATGKKQKVDQIKLPDLNGKIKKIFGN